MLSIRLSRIGKNKQPSYRIIVTEKRRDPWGKYVEDLGHYNPRANPRTFVVNKERVQYWISQGAQPSGTIRNILIDEGVIQGEKVRVTTMSKRHAARLAAKTKALEVTAAAGETPALPNA